MHAVRPAWNTLPAITPTLISLYLCIILNNVCVEQRRTVKSCLDADYNVPA